MAWTPIGQNDAEVVAGEMSMLHHRSANGLVMSPGPGDYVTIEVAGPLEAGERPNEDQRNRLRVQIGSVACPRGWGEALKHMVCGDRARLRCRQSYAQGTMLALGGDRRDMLAGRRLSRRLSLIAMQATGRRASVGNIPVSIAEGDEDAESADDDDESAGFVAVSEPLMEFDVRLERIIRLRRPARALRWLKAVVVALEAD
eukprot:g84.t1